MAGDDDGGGGEDRLSDLSDDLLRRILHFVPFKEAASTSVLSRRWARPASLWRSSGAVNLAVRAYNYDDNRRHADGTFLSHDEIEDAGVSCKHAFLRAATSALSAAGEVEAPPITRLTLRVVGREESVIERFLCCGIGEPWERHGADAFVSDLVSHPAARRVEELRLSAAVVSSSSSSCSDDLEQRKQENETHRSTGVFGLAVASLPSSATTLRVLDLTRCTLTPAMAAARSPLLPRLTSLRLSLCSVDPMLLQAVLDASPALAAVRLESVFFLLPPAFFQQTVHGVQLQAEPAVVRLSFQAATSLAFSLCGKETAHRRRCGKSGGWWAIDVDAPKLRCFRYKGLVRRFMLRPTAATAEPPAVEEVDLHFLRYDDDGGREARRVLFWQFLGNFTTGAAGTRTLKLKVGNDLKEIAVSSKQQASLVLFPGVERLELEGTHRRKSKTAAVAITNLLHCCPALSEISLKLTDAETALGYKEPQYGREFLERKHRLDYSRSIDRFVRRREGLSMTAAVSMEDSRNFLVNEFSYDDDDDDVPGIPGLSGRSFPCLQRTLRRVSLQFRLDNDNVSSCLGLRLVKFFAQHATVLEEIRVDNGNRRLNEHLRFCEKTETAFAPDATMPTSATASSMQNKNLALAVNGSSKFFTNHSASSLDSTKDLNRSTVGGGFTVLPLQRKS